MKTLSPRLVELKRRFVVPVGQLPPVHRKEAVRYYYCPYAPCCSQCAGIFTLREVLGHLRRTHEHDVERIKKLLAKGLPTVPMVLRRGR